MKSAQFNLVGLPKGKKPKKEKAFKFKAWKPLKRQLPIPEVYPDEYRRMIEHGEESSNLHMGRRRKKVQG